jgi:tRNA-splicing ligase RtcB
MHWVRQAFEKIFHTNYKNLGLELIYDVAHNIAKIEEHILDGKKVKLYVHRKGATRAFPANHPVLSKDYLPIGQPAIVPGDMGTASYIVVGTEQGMQEVFGTTCHGAGRVLSRAAAMRMSRGRAIDKELLRKGIIVKSASRGTLAEEMPEAYKDVTQVVMVLHNAGICKVVVKLNPLGVIKG